MTAINPSGKITEGCSGIYNENQIHNWKKIVDFIHKNTSSKIAIQLGHSGRKGAIKKPWETNNESTEHLWELISASAIPYSEQSSIPREMTLEDMDKITNDFVIA